MHHAPEGFRIRENAREEGESKRSEQGGKGGRDVDSRNGGGVDPGG